MDSSGVRKHITILTPCFREVENVEPLVKAVTNIMKKCPEYTYNHLFIDNASNDGTQEKLRGLAQDYSHLQVIFNARNFGQNRSPFYGLLQAKGEAVIAMNCDFQDPPDLIPVFLKHWENGKKAVLAIKSESEENRIIYFLRGLYYRILSRFGDVKTIEHFTGYGLYDRSVIELFRSISDSNPYLRGLIPDLGITYESVQFKQPLRKRGSTKNNFYSLYDMAMLGLTSHSKIPLRLATFVGFTIGMISLLVALFYFCFKILFWNSFVLGTAPLVVGLFFFAAVQLLFIGIIGEYIGSILTHVLGRPLVIEKERINI
mgnify:CR=1 FL=1|jgi:glycosyltransferase involved in cell wall biosynthesis|tara:strand:- start:317 stop:1264 length:948 start_codon:yes stop_codon:yes gene_type:complete